MTERERPVYDQDWQRRYADVVVTPDKAVARLRPGQRVFLGTGAAQPQRLVCALLERAGDLPDIQLYQLMALAYGPYPYPALRERFSVTSFFVASNVPEFTQEGLKDYTPLFASDLPRLFASGELPLDAALIQVTPPDERGVVSLGPSVDIVKSAAANAALVIAQVNSRMPWTFGDSLLDIGDIDLLVPADHELPEAPLPRSDETTRQIGEYLAALVEDASTVAVGLGSTPQSVLPFLREKKDLGVHTEVLSDGFLDLIEAGAVTGARKAHDRGRVVAAFSLGSRRLYDALDGNPLFHLHPTEYVNDVNFMNRMERMVSINGALEVDITGQVAADSRGREFRVGLGGQVDFNRGAAGSPDGKAIFALASTSHQGTASRIVAQFSPGAGVAATRGEVHYIVTEYGAAFLHGKSIQQRALALISIAHPDFRAELLQAAIGAGFVREELAYVGAGRISSGPRELRTSLLLEDGTKLAIRPVEPADEPQVLDMFYALSRESVYLRFMQYLKRMPQKQIQDFVYIDHRTEVSIAATLPSPAGDEIIAVGGYYLDPRTNRAEVAFVVRDEWQDRGIGSFLLRHLITIAKRNGIAGFFGEALVENRSMQAILRKSGCTMRSQVDAGIFMFELDF